MKKLEEEVFSKIAAGEVIERPSNALKELIENSLDAKATVINVRILDSGLKMIEVRDNGNGILKEDLPLVIERYATSKISSEKDLLRIQTYGFRGEALYAISRISDIQIISKTSEQNEAYSLLAHQGNILKIEPTTLPIKNGTIIKVTNLFFNNPVRKRFILSERNELSNIIKTFKYFALINPDVLFTLHVEDKPKYNLIPTTPESRIKELLKIQNLAREEIEFENYKIVLLLSSDYRYEQVGRNNFFVFVNRRIVFLNEIEKVVINTFKDVLGERGRIEGVIAIDLPPEEVDSNIHPRKLEVRFLKPLLIKNLLQKVIKNFINNHLISKPLVLHDEERSETPKIDQPNWYQSVSRIIDKLQEKIHEKMEEKTEEKTVEKTEEKTETIQEKIKTNELRELKNTYQAESQLTPKFELQLESYKSTPLKILHYWDNCYFLVLSDEGFFVVDQHNASEKVIYHKLLSVYKKEMPLQTQKLIIPLTIEINGELTNSELNSIEFLKNLGFEIITKYHQEKTKIMISSYPSIIPFESLGEVVKTVIHNENILDEEEVLRDFLSKIACKSAIKKGQKLSEGELKALFQELLSIELNPYFCPHGRNVMIKISFDDINKMFERKE